MTGLMPLGAELARCILRDHLTPAEITIAVHGGDKTW
jgi:hypothetical protein